jgi:TonB family protein
VHKKIVRTLYCILSMGMFLGISQSAYALDTYHQYLSDVLLLENRLMLDPDRPIAYDNSDNGRLLKSVLDKDRFQSANAVYQQAIAAGKKTETLPVLMQPVIDIYEKAFSDFGLKYENEYLDTLQVSVILISGPPPVLNMPSTAAGSETTPPANAAATSSIQKMNAAVQMMMVAARRAVANAILDDIQKMKFSAAGGQRAFQIAESIMPTTEAQTGSNVSSEPTPGTSPAPRVPATPSPPSGVGTFPDVKSITYIRRPQPAYPASAKANQEEGTVVLRALIDELGRVRTVFITKSSGVPALDLAAKKAMENVLYNPYILNGKATPVFVSVPITFKLG